MIGESGAQLSTTKTEEDGRNGAGEGEVEGADLVTNQALGSGFDWIGFDLIGLDLI